MALADGVAWCPFEPRFHFELALLMPLDRSAGTAAELFHARLQDFLACGSDPGWQAKWRGWRSLGP